MVLDGSCPPLYRNDRKDSNRRDYSSEMATPLRRVTEAGSLLYLPLSISTAVDTQVLPTPSASFTVWFKFGLIHFDSTTITFFCAKEGRSQINDMDSGQPDNIVDLNADEATGWGLLLSSPSHWTSSKFNHLKRRLAPSEVADRGCTNKLTKYKVSLSLL